MRELMTNHDSYLFDSPPVNEVGFAFVTDGPFVDPYDIRSLHDLFRGDYPKAERQSPVTQLEGAPLGFGQATISDEDQGVPPRWWFVANSGAEIVQVQERFLGWNWRRGVPADKRVDYPGFETLDSKARDALELLLEWRQENQGSVPPPAAAQLMYDNMICLRTEDGGTRRLAEVLKCWNSLEPAVPSFGWTLRWFEPMGEPGIIGEPLDTSKSSAVVTVNLSLVGVISGDEKPLPVLRVLFTALQTVSSWNDGFAFFHSAHDYIRNTFVRLITDEIQTSWGKR